MVTYSSKAHVLLSYRNRVAYVVVGPIVEHNPRIRFANKVWY